MKHLVFVLMLWLSFFSAAFAAEPVTLVAGPDSIPLAGHIEYLRDEAGAWTLDDVRSEKFADQFTALDADAANFGFTLATYWYRLTFHNPARKSAQPADWVLEVLFPVLDTLDFHLIRRDASTQTFLTGDLRQPAPGQLSHRHFAIPLRIAAGEEVTLYLRAQNQSLHSVELRARTAVAFQAHAGTDSLIVGLSLGILLVMTLYNLIIFLTIRDRGYLWYVLWLGSITGLWFVFTGYARQYGNPLSESAPGLINISYMYWWNLVGLSANLFFREFLQIRQHLPRLERFLWMPLFWLGAILLLLIPFIPYIHCARLATYYVVLSSVISLVAGGYLALKGMRAAKFFLLAWGVLLAITIVTMLSGLGVLPSFFFTPYAAMVAICFGVTVLSLALADRLNTERRERERLGRLRQYLPQSVAQLVVEGEGGKLLEPKRRQVTVCVIDLRGFTPFSETSAPEDVMNVLREFYDSMGKVVEQHGGTVEHFAGDSMLIFFNAPLEIPKHEEQAVQTALEMRSAFESLRAKWMKLGHELGLGIGIADGYATIGAIGFSGRSQYAAIGAVTNLASRLCSSAAHGEILTTSRVLAAVESIVESESAGEQTIKGFSKPVQVMRVMALRAT